MRTGVLGMTWAAHWPVFRHLASASMLPFTEFGESLRELRVRLDVGATAEQAAEPPRLGRH